jgi:hypothetical protein
MSTAGCTRVAKTNSVSQEELILRLDGGWAALLQRQRVSRVETVLEVSQSSRKPVLSHAHRLCLSKSQAFELILLDRAICALC